MSANKQPQHALYDHFVNIKAMTDKEYKRTGRDMKIAYGIDATPFGDVLLAQADGRICWLSFTRRLDKNKALDVLRAHWRLSDHVEAIDKTAKVIRTIFFGKGEEFSLLVKGTDFQVRVWRALPRIPHGELASYKGVAASIGKPVAYSRAVGNAISKNHIAYLLPCHRVLAAGGPGGYRWGTDIKSALLAAEQAGQAGVP